MSSDHLHSDILEKRAIGALLEHRGAKAVIDRHGGETLFWRESSRWWYRAASAVLAEVGPLAVVDGAAVVTWLTSRSAFADSGGGRMYQELRAKAAPIETLESVATGLAELRSRRAIETLGGLLKEMAQAGEPIEECLNSMQRVSVDISITPTRSAAEVAREVFDRHNTLATGGADTETVSTKVLWLDHLLGGGVSHGHSYYIGGLYKMGKTKLAGYIAWAMMRQGWCIDWYSVEMSELEMMRRFISAEAGVSEMRISKGSVQPVDWPKFVDAAGQIAPQWQWRHQKRGEWKAEDIAASTAARVLSRPEDKHLVVVDYIQCVTLAKDRGLKGHEVTAKASGIVNAISKDLNVPVLVVYQLAPGKVEGRGNSDFTPVPEAGDARGSSQIMMDANHLITVHRPWWKKHGDISRFTVADLHVSRNVGDPRRLYLYSDFNQNRYAPWEGEVPRPFEPMGEEPVW